MHADADVRAISPVVRIWTADSNTESEIRRDVPVSGSGREAPEKSGAEDRNKQRAHDRPLIPGEVRLGTDDIRRT